MEQKEEGWFTQRREGAKARRGAPGENARDRETFAPAEPIAVRPLARVRLALGATSPRLRAFA